MAVMTTTKYMRQNGINFWSTRGDLYTGGLDLPLVHRRGITGPIQCDVYPSTFDKGEIAEIVKWNLEHREGKEASREAHREFLISAGLAHKEKED